MMGLFLRLSLLTLVFAVSKSDVAYGKTDLQRLALLPVEASESLKSQAESSWWSIRGELTATGRFLVATKRAMVAKDLFLPRSHLRAVEVIGLSQNLDADLIGTASIKGRSATLRFYGSERGSLVWEGKTEMSSSLPVHQQVEGTLKSLVHRFLVEIPYQGQVVTSRPSASRESWGVGGTVRVHLGNGDFFAEGDPVIFVDFREVSVQPLFQGGGQLQPLGRGEIISVELPYAQVKILSLDSDLRVNSGQFVSIPDGLRRMQENLGLGGELKVALPGDFSMALETKKAEEEEEKLRLVQVLSWVASLAAFLLLAF